MKRSAFIIIASVLALGLIAVWVYLLFFRVETANEQSFTDLNFGDTTDTTFEPVDTEPEPVVDVLNTETVRQLTTEPVVGFTETIDKFGLEVINYVEAGTGHIYEINLVTGEERRVSGITFANIKKADLTPDGQHVMIQTGSGLNKEFVLGTLSSSTGEFVFNAIEEEIADFTSTVDNDFLFTSPSVNGGLLASRYNPENSTAEILFEIPFREAVVRWGDTATSTHYIYPKASAELEGYLYRSVGGVFERLSASGLGLTAVGNDDGVIYAYQDDRNYTLWGLRISEQGFTRADFSSLLSILTEKCTPYKLNRTFICATDNTLKTQNAPDDWYEGERIYNDDIWEIDPIEQSVARLVRIEEESGREIDLINPEIGNSNKNLYFQNKTDQTLWMFILPSPTQN